MFSLYPSNRLEHLSALLNGLLTAQPSSVFESDCILVENPGMQHWLHLDLAAKNAISMNLDFPLTSRFVWDIARIVLGDEAIPAQSPYRREVLRFRIAALLQNEQLISHPHCAPLVEYWQQTETTQRASTKAAEKRMMLAIEIADAFEQYLMFRPEWLAAWENNEDPVNTVTSQWQAHLWRCLTEQQPWHPANLLQNTTELLHEAADQQHRVSGLPSRIILFAVNALAPSLLSFFDALAKHCDVHFFYLNPSVSYWGDAKSDRALAYQQRLENFQKSTKEEQSNRLLANLGQHGRDLLNRFTQMETFEVSAFDAPSSDTLENSSVLHILQSGIYHGETTQRSEDMSESDSTVTLVSCHTPLRELQVLHDYLLKRMTENERLLGKDIVVLCPAIEDYAPFIYSVFSRPGLDDESRISCTVSDRTLLTTDPHVSAFMSMLAMTDSRFTATSVMSMLDYSDIAAQFGFDSDGIEKIGTWLNSAAIRWGLDSEQKAASAQLEQASAQNSWDWGLQRLLMGLACSDSPTLTDDLLTVPDVEGLDGVLLGNLIRFLAFLQSFAATLTQRRTVDQWVDVLRDLCEQLFGGSGQNPKGLDTVFRALSDLRMQAEQADFYAYMTLGEINELLNMAFSTPDVRNQFLTGHVTFCSMMPMRSVPFKVVAVLGLNDGQFPRKSVPQSLNLMSSQGPQPGDRSRAKEDRYLFLEAVISAREALYLSYQGANSRDDSERQPSPVLSLLVDEVNTLIDGGGKFTQFPLHHFSRKNYLGDMISTNRGGHRLANILLNPNSTDAPFSVHLDVDDIDTQWDVSQIAKCFENPLMYLAKQRLGVDLHIQEQVFDDDEPFDVDWLTQYQVLESASEFGFEHTIERVRKSGAMPDNIIAESIYQQWDSGLTRLMQTLPTDFDELSNTAESVNLSRLTFAAGGKIQNGQLLDFHLGSQSAKRKLHQWLRHLIFSVNSDQPISSITYYIDWKQEGAIKQVNLAPITSDDARQQLLNWEMALMRCLQSPSFYHAKMGEALARAKSPDSVWLVHMQGNEQLSGILNDPYYQWLCDSTPTQIDWQEQIIDLYQPMVKYTKDVKVKHDK